MAKKRNLLARVPLAPVFAVLFGSAAATLVVATPQWLFEQWVAASGLASVVSVAVPPLGIKARLLAIVVSFALVAGAVWAVSALVERLLSGPRPRPEYDAEEDDDILDLGSFAEPASATRGPIFAERELGAPLMSDAALATAWRQEAVESDVLDLPIPELEPEVLEAPEPVEAVEDVPFEPVVDAPELAVPLAAEEFVLPEATADEPEQLPGESSIDALIRRLEVGLARRGTRGDPGPSAPTMAPPTPATPSASGVAPPATRLGDWIVQRGDNDPLDEDTTRALETLRRMAG